MAEIDNDCPAFPNGRITLDAEQNDWIARNPGMTLRDYFAGQALASVLSAAAAIDASITRDEFLQSAQDAARACYALADAMLTERAKGGQ